MRVDTAVKIREAELADAPGISTLLAELGYPADESETVKRLTRLAGRDTDTVLVATREGKVIGVVGVHTMPLLHKAGNAGRITALAVTESAREQGVGAALVQAAEQYAWSHDCVQVEVTSGDHRPGAHQFYEQIGYRIDSRRFIKTREGHEI